MNLLLTLYWHYGELCGSYAMRQFSLVHYRARRLLRITHMNQVIVGGVPNINQKVLL